MIYSGWEARGGASTSIKRGAQITSWDLEDSLRGLAVEEKKQGGCTCVLVAAVDFVGTPTMYLMFFLVGTRLSP